MEKDLEEMAGSSDEESTAAVATTLVKIYSDILFFPASFPEENELVCVYSFLPLRSYLLRRTWQLK